MTYLGQQTNAHIVESQRPSPIVSHVPNGSVPQASGSVGISSQLPSTGRPQMLSAPGTTPFPTNYPAGVGRPVVVPPVGASPLTVTPINSVSQVQYASGPPARPLQVNNQVLANGQQQQFSRPLPPQQFTRPMTMPMQTSSGQIMPGQIKQEYRPSGLPMGYEPVRTDGQSKEIVDEAENERTRLENRERKKRWREANEDRNKDNDLRCRVNKRAHKLYGKEASKAKDMWIEEEFNKRKSKRQEKEGKGPDGNLLIEGTDLSSLNHDEMNSVIMTTLSDFAANPAAPVLKDNADLTAMLQKLRTDPDSIKAMLVGQPRTSISLTRDNIFNMNSRSADPQQTFSDDDDDDRDSNLGSTLGGNIDIGTFAGDPPNATDMLGTGAATGAAGNTADQGLNRLNVNSQSPPNRRFSMQSNGNDTVSRHQTYGIGSGFEAQVALALSSDLFRLISMQPVERTQRSVPLMAGQPDAAPSDSAHKAMVVKQEIET